MPRRRDPGNFVRIDENSGGTASNYAPIDASSVETFGNTTVAMCDGISASSVRTAARFVKIAGNSAEICAGVVNRSEVGGAECPRLTTNYQLPTTN